jgi:hypothetical protein
MNRTSQNIERVFYKLSPEEVREMVLQYMDRTHDIVLPQFMLAFHEDGSATITADYVTE